MRERMKPLPCEPRGRIFELCRQFLGDDCGTEIVELAMALPILVMITFGALELLLFLCCYVGATYGSRTAVRYASTHGASSLQPCTTTSLTAIVKSYVVGMPAGQVVVNPTWSPNNFVGGTVTVQVSISYPTGIPFVKLSAMTASTTATGVILQ